MKKALYCLFIILTAIGKISFGQTNVGGGIYTNTTWTLLNSPYLVTDTVYVFPNVTLTIEPGVIVEIANGKAIEFRQSSSLVANGTVNDSITFTSNAATPGSYYGMNLQSSSSISLQYCNFYYAVRGIIGTTDFLSMTNCNFEYNNEAFLCHPTVLNIQDCSFRNNSIAISGASGAGKFSNVVISNNQIGIKDARITLENSIVDSNASTGIITEWNDTLVNNDIKYNGVGIELHNSSPNTPIVIIQNHIENNSVGLKSVSPGMVDSTFHVYCNKICNNILYDAQNISAVNTNMLKNNYWCTTDSAIISSHIYDGYDDPSYGLINFVPFDTIGCYINGCNLLINTTVTNATCDTCHNGAASSYVLNGLTPFIYTWNSSPIQTTQTAIGLSSGNYSICVTDGHGCTACSSVFVDSTNCTGYSIQSVPISSTCISCNDGSAYANITGGTHPYSYTWYSGPVQNTDTAIGLIAGLYSVCITDLYGCLDCDTFTITTGNCSAHFNLYPDTLPHSYLAVNMASGIAPISYSWNWGDASAVDTNAYPSHTYTAAGFYNICLTISDSVGCTDTYCNPYYLLRQSETSTIVNVSVVQSLPTNVLNNQSTNPITIYPNPSTGRFAISNIPKNSKTSVNIISPLGSLLYRLDNVNEDSIVDVDLSPGIYFFIIDSDKNSKIISLMIQEE